MNLGEWLWAAIIRKWQQFISWCSECGINSKTNQQNLVAADLCFALYLCFALLCFALLMLCFDYALLSSFSHVQLFTDLWTVVCQTLLSMGFLRQEYWSGSPCPSPGDFPNPGIQPMFLISPALIDGFFTTSITWDAPFDLADAVISVVIGRMTRSS